MTDEERAKQQAEQQERQRQAQLRQSALLLAEDQHASDEDIIELKHALDDAQLAEKKMNDELRAMRMDTQLARAKYEKALDKYIDPRYQLSDSDWEKLMARFQRG